MTRCKKRDDNKEEEYEKDTIRYICPSGFSGL